MKPMSLLQSLADRQWTARTLLMLGATAFLYQMSEVLSKHSAWAEFATPPAVGEIALAVVYALVAVLGALGIRVAKSDTTDKKEGA